MNELQLSYSSIKDFELLTPYEWKLKWIDRVFPREVKRAFSFGSLLDCLLFEPETLKSRFVILDNSLPSDAVCDIIANVVKYKDEQSHVSTPEQTIEGYSRELNQILLDKNYWSSRKAATNLKNVLRDGADYFQALNNARGKTVVSQADVDKCLRMRENAWNDPLIRPFLISEEGIDLEFQKTIKTSYILENGQVLIKTIFDALQINHRDKTIRIADLKSTAQSSQFDFSVRKYRYGAQVGLYDYSLANTLKGFLVLYTILPPVNIIVDKTTEQASLYEYKWSDLELERYGNENIKGWHYLIEEIVERFNQNNWE